MAYKYGTKSQKQLDTCDSRLRTIFAKVIEFIDVTALQGRRTFTEQLKNIGRKVSKTINSRHIPRDQNGAIEDDGLSKALDAAPHPLRWPKMPSRIRTLIEGDAALRAELGRFVKDTGRFYHLAGAVLAVAHYEKIPIRQGVDWDGDGDFFDQSFDDLPHTEIDEPLANLKLTEAEQARVDNAFAIARGVVR